LFKEMKMLPLYSGRFQQLKKLLGDTNNTQYKLCPHRQLVLCEHDRDHIAVSLLAPVVICGYSVDGISGIDIPEFHDYPSTPLYPGELDEARVAIHQVMVRPSLLAVLRAGLWLVRIAKWGGNPIRVVADHYKSIN
jgi:hypothetical protein